MLEEKARFWARVALCCVPLGILGLFCQAALAAAPCIASPQLQARLRATPGSETYASLGSWFADRKRFDCAAAAFASASRLQPNSATLAYLWGLSLSSAGQDQQALAPLNRAIELDANDIRPHLVLAAALERLKEPSESEAQWRAALAIDPESAVALDSLSQQFVDRKNFSSVIALLDRPGKEAVRTPIQSLNLGIAYAGSAELDKAANVLREGLNNNPESLPIANELAVVLMLTGRDREAYGVFDLALSRHPDHQPTQILYLHTLVSSNSEKAPEYGRKLLALYPDQWEVLYLVAVLESREGDFEHARTHLQRSVALNPGYYQAQDELGSVLSKLGDLAGAREHLEKAIALGDNQPEVEYDLAKVLQRLGDTAQAQEKLRIYRQLKKTRSDTIQAAGKAEVGDQAMAAGDPAKAASLYREALETDPEEPLLYYKLSKALDKMKDIAGEKTALQRTLELNPNLAEAQNQMGYLADREGDFPRAESYFRAAVRASPSYIAAWINLAATLAGEDKMQDAKQALAHALEIDPDNAQARGLADALATAHAGP